MYQLTKVCLKVKFISEIDQWVIDKTEVDPENVEQVEDRGWLSHIDHDDLGASIFDGIGCYGLNNKAILYEKMTTSHDAGVNPGHYSSLFPIETIEVSFALRDANDPMLLAKTLSHNSFDFGLSA